MCAAYRFTPRVRTHWSSTSGMIQPPQGDWPMSSVFRRIEAQMAPLQPLQTGQQVEMRVGMKDWRGVAMRDASARKPSWPPTLLPQPSFLAVRRECAQLPEPRGLPRLRTNQRDGPGGTPPISNVHHRKLVGLLPKRRRNALVKLPRELKPVAIATSSIDILVSARRSRACSRRRPR